MPAPDEVFLSHATADRKFADRLASIIRSRGISVWYSRTNLLGAQRWHDEIGNALARCDAFVLVLSPSSIKSTWVYYELIYALSERRYVGKIVPIIKTPCNYEHLSWTLGAIQHIDFSKDFNHGCAQLLRTWDLEIMDAARSASSHSPKRRKHRK